MKKITLLLLFWGCSFYAQNINFTDLAFKNVLLSANAVTNFNIAKDLDGNPATIDTNNDGEIQVSEALEISYLNVLGTNAIQNIEGIHFFENLKTLLVQSQQINSVDLSENNLLETISFNYNFLTNLDVSSLVNLKNLNVQFNPLTSINLSNSSALLSIYCSDTQLTTLDLSQCSNLMELNCPNTPLTTIDLFGTKVTSLTAGGDNLETIFAKNGLPSTIQIFSSPNLKYLCIDENEMSPTTLNVFQNLHPNCVVNLYCSFVPGGTYYTIEGNVKLDTNLNGCDGTDVNLPNLKLDVFNGSTTGSFYSKANGEFFIPLQSGSYSVSPILENPSYFTFQPTIFTADFPENASPLNQSICLTPNGIHKDLEIVYMRLPRSIGTPGIPGYDVRYKIIYKNKGNQIQSGQVTLNYQDEVMNFTVANPIQTSVANGIISWNFTNFLPGETRTIFVTFLLNSPQDTPPLDADDQLSFDAEITDIQGIDDNNDDNFFNLSETVQSSMDPNDIACLEGDTVGPDQIGKYVHYLIQFENIGTAEAINVVIKNTIDATKFDVNSLIPLDSNYNFETRRKDNDYEFIFENINLPFDDENNDGYLVYKIKLRNNLIIGNTFTNQANIFFDFNFPIETNVASTTIQALSVNDFSSDNFSISPNPTSGNVNINGIDNLQFSVEIYDLTGKLMVKEKQQSQIDLSAFQNGIYFIKIRNNQTNTSVVKKIIKH
ncbi:T9SS type A sorting domain-containing protein [Flavobacterium azooxidireducens]|uniref:T9SS type A sorting domain-containing protein n=1 Tax=Flavobacterium azooxidireducens TaxID=1871076 RepID=A0ABY4KJ06_9FLAO|nr:T9SS type A sorting domain-containing protein [Flavobacterium azooxidireducens]UPQ80795.1 T9SS type A sorting domain-containing protein [Flavobacterium azooxidireducens]